jgi:hypothetical protein
MAMAPAARAQVVIGIGIQPVCSYGYYGYAPYACAPMGYYGSGYFYNGIFLGMGPWGGWGYSHGWGSHRFVNEGGGNYHGGPGRVSYRANGGPARGGQVRGNATVQRGGGKPNAGRTTARPQASHASGGEHAGGGAHEGGKS